MKTKEILPRSIVDEAIEAAGVEAEIYFDYSGRAMYNETCFGLVVDRVSDVTRILMKISKERSALADTLADAWKQDSLGLSFIVYFPGFSLT